MKSLIDVSSKETIDPKSVSITLTFKDNEYFTNKTLELTCLFKKD